MLANRVSMRWVCSRLALPAGHHQQRTFVVIHRPALGVVEAGEEALQRDCRSLTAAVMPLCRKTSAVALGSNLGDSLALLGCCPGLAAVGRYRFVSLLAYFAPLQSAGHRSADFINAVVLLDWQDTPEQLLKQLQLEAAAGRQRLIVNGPRLILICSGAAMSNAAVPSLSCPIRVWPSGVLSCSPWGLWIQLWCRQARFSALPPCWRGLSNWGRSRRQSSFDPLTAGRVKPAD